MTSLEGRYDKAVSLLRRALDHPDGLVPRQPHSKTELRKSIELFLENDNYSYARFADAAPIVGADPSWWGQKIKVTNKVKERVVRSTYTVVGIDLSRNVNYMVVTTQRSGFRYTSVETVARCLGGGAGVLVGGPNRRTLDVG